MSNEKIAKIMNLTVDSVKAYKKRGKQTLKSKLGMMYFGGVLFFYADKCLFS